MRPFPRFRPMLACAALVLLPGCYRATKHTGLRPAAEVRERVWPKPFVMADAPMAEIAELAGCPAGVAKVETTRTVMDQIAGLFDGGASSGVKLLITCAAVRPVVEAPAADSAVDARSVPDSARSTPTTGEPARP